MSEVAQYIYDKYGKFPGIRSTIMLPGFVQAHHIDTDFYDAYYREGAYLETHARHSELWHDAERRRLTATSPLTIWRWLLDGGEMGTLV
jgi:hypothetical protein